MAKPELVNGAAKPIPMARQNMPKRPAKITKRTSKRSRRVYRTGNGLVSLRKTHRGFASIVRANSLQPPLLRLPAELRNKIFKYALGGTRIVCYPTQAGQSWHNPITDRSVSTSERVVLSLPRVCRQIYSETATLVYSENIFHFRTGAEHNNFLAARKQAQVEAMTIIIPELNSEACRNGMKGLHKTLENLGRCKGLKNLYLGRDMGLWRRRRLFDFADQAGAAVVAGHAGHIDVEVF